MSRVASIHTRIDPTLKHDAEEILHQLGLNPSQAINAFYAQIVHLLTISLKSYSAKNNKVVGGYYFSKK